MKKQNASPAKGQRLAEKARQKMNQATDSERQRLLAGALSVIYKGGKGDTCVARR
jgi:hypothetical protein